MSGRQPPHPRHLSMNTCESDRGIYTPRLSTVSNVLLTRPFSKKNDDSATSIDDPPVLQTLPVAHCMHEIVCVKTLVKESLSLKPPVLVNAVGGCTYICVSCYQNTYRGNRLKFSLVEPP